MQFPLLFRLMCLLLVGSLVVPPLEAARRKTSSSAKSKKAKKGKKGKMSASKRKGKGSQRKKYAKGKRGKGKKLRGSYSFSRSSTPQRKTNELPLTMTERENAQRRR